MTHHGTYGGYARDGCRCPDCRAASAEYSRGRRSRLRSPLEPTFLATPWAAQAACRGADQTVFFPVRGELVGPARRVCAGCPVRESCLEYALANNEKFGVWGGKSERERRRIRRRRAA